MGLEKKKTQVLFNKLITSKGFCEMCGSRVNQLQCSHIYSIGAHQGLRYDILNVVCHCSYCHRFKWHDDPPGGWEWFKSKYPERLEYLLFATQQFKKFTMDDLLKVRELVKNKDLKGLITFNEQYQNRGLTSD